MSTAYKECCLPWVEYFHGHWIALQDFQDENQQIVWLTAILEMQPHWISWCLKFNGQNNLINRAFAYWLLVPVRSIGSQPHSCHPLHQSIGDVHVEDMPTNWINATNVLRKVEEFNCVSFTAAQRLAIQCKEYPKLEGINSTIVLWLGYVNESHN